MRKWTVIATGFCVAGLITLLLLVSCGGGDGNNIYVYHFNPSARRLEAEVRPLPTTQLENVLFDTVVGYMHSGPVSSNLASTWPLELAPLPEDLIQAVMLEDDVLIVFLTPVFYDMLPLEQTLFKTALIYTMESVAERALRFNTVTDINILVADDYQYALDILMLKINAEEGDEIPDVPWLIYDRSHGIFNDPFLSSSHIAPHTFSHLHFVDESGIGLIIESHTTEELDHHREERARYALQLLISGLRPEGAMFPIPTETIVRNIIIDRTDIFVDLSADFDTRFTGDYHMARLMIYSIVNTLIGELSPTQVHFTIDTRQQETFHGIEDFHLGFSQNNTLLLSYVLERTAEEEAWEQTQ
ncbi:MAG: GerMN domain-containing protein [Defluviitaleaceae bacterium]|nr:GerMN domain-containing protein [Defluviitaleaceae bacterium]